MSAGIRGWWRRWSAKDSSPWPEEFLTRLTVEVKASARRRRRERAAARRRLSGGGS